MHRLVCVYTCQNTALLEITCRCSNDTFPKANNKGADQSTEAGLHLCCSQTPKNGFLTSRPIYRGLHIWKHLRFGKPNSSFTSDKNQLAIFFFCTVNFLKFDHFSFSVLKKNIGFQGWNSQNACQNSKQGRP